jgi:hypothetical protein
MDAALEQLVRSRARFRCEYCLLPEKLVSTPFQFDHIIARFHGGATTADNLAYACFHCNNFKGPNIAGIDPESGQIVRLFHPRRDTRSDHFNWNGERLIGLTPFARATIATLRLNHPHRLIVRRSLLLEGVAFV